MRTYVVRRAPTTSAVPALKPTFCSWLLAQQAVDVIVVQELHHWGCIRRRITLGLKASGWILSGADPAHKRKQQYWTELELDRRVQGSHRDANAGQRPDLQDVVFRLQGASESDDLTRQQLIQEHQT